MVKKEPKPKSQKPADFESQMQRLQAIVQELERADLSLEQNIALYKEGHMLAESCKKLLEQAKHEILLCTEGGLEPFSVTTASANDE